MTKNSLKQKYEKALYDGYMKFTSDRKYYYLKMEKKINHKYKIGFDSMMISLYNNHRFVGHIYVEEDGISEQGWNMLVQDALDEELK